MPLIMRSSAAFSWLVGSFGSIRFFSEGTWSARGCRWPTGAASGSNCWPECVDGGADRFREPAVRAIATEVSTWASNAIVVINFRMMGLPSWAPSRSMVTGSSIARCGKPRVLFRCSRRDAAQSATRETSNHLSAFGPKRKCLRLGSRPPRCSGPVQRESPFSEGAGNIGHARSPYVAH